MSRVFKWFEAVQGKICSVMLAFMCLMVVVQVVLRYLFNFSFVWSEELIRYLMIWMVMIGSALVQARNEHVRIDFFPMLAGPRGRLVMEAIFRLCTLVFLAILIIKGVKMVYFNRLFESSGLRISMLWASLAIPLGALLMGVYTFRDLVRDVRRLLFRPADKSADKLAEEDRRAALANFQGPPSA
jgi:TRAP-type C4-dicarboxylate transport system permease small subunit